MAIPSPAVEAAFGADWDDTAATFTDVSAAVHSWSCDRKYGWESGRYRGGRATVVLYDSDRTYDPLHASGAYYGDIVAGTPVQITETELLFYGFVDRVTRTYTPRGRGVTTLQCVDLWAMLNGILVSGTYAQDTTGNRAGAILNAYLPAAFYLVNSPTPLVTMPERTYYNETLLTAIEAVALAEGGMLWVDKFGTLQFAGRHYPATTRMVNDQATLSDFAADASVVRYAPVSIEWDSGDIVNTVSVSRGGTPLAPVEDATSIARYGRRALSLGSLEVIDDIQATSNANRVIAQFKDPMLRIPPAVFDVIADSGTEYTHAYQRDLWDRVRWKMTPAGGGATEDRDAFIVGVSHSFTAEPADREPPWVVSWDLVDSAIFDRLDPANWWRWGGTYSQWGGTYAGSKWAP